MAENLVASEVTAGQGLYLAAAAKLLPPLRQGRPVSGSCVFRWCTDGLKLPDGSRVCLEHVRLGGRVLTSKGAIERFLQAQARTPGSRPDQPATRTPTKRTRQHEQARRQLQEQFNI